LEGQPISFAALVIIATAAFLVPIAVRRIRFVRIPVVVGELVVGIAVGKSGLNIVAPEPWLEFLSLLGITYLMFLSGVEIDFALLGKLARRQEGRRLFFLTGCYFILVLAAASATGWLLFRSGFVHHPWLIALILTTVSVGVVLPMIKEKHLAGTEYGQTILVTALLLDFATMLLLAVLVSGADSGQIALIGVLFAAVIAVYAGGKKMRESAIMAELAHATSQIGVRGAFMLIFILAYLSERLGVEVILGAFMAGAVVSLISRSDETSLHLKLDAIGFGFLVPIFFITVGAEFDVAALLSRPGSLGFALAIVAAAYGVKILPATVFAKRYGMKDALALGVLVTPGLSLTVAAAEIGYRLELLEASAHSAIILLAILTAAVSPVLFERVGPRASQAREQSLIIAGANERGILLATRLSEIGGRLLLLDKDPTRVEAARARGFEALLADIEDFKAWQEISPDVNTTVVITTQDDDVNLRVVEILKERHDVGRVIAHASDPEVAEAMERRGAKTVSPATSTLSMMENLVRYPDLLALLGREDESVTVQKVTVQSPALSGVRVRDLGVPQGALILSIGRGRESIIPRGETQLEVGDVLTLAGQKEHVEQAVLRLGGW